MSNLQTGSNVRPPSQQFAKVSIGIMVEKTPKMGSSAGKKDETVFLVKETSPLCQEKIVEQDRGQRTKATFVENQILGEGDVSPWVSTGFMHHEVPNVQNDFRHESDDPLHEKLDSVAYEEREDMHYEVPDFPTVHFHAKASVIQSDVMLHEKKDNATHSNRIEKSGNSERKEENAFPSLQNLHTIHKGNAEGLVKFRENRSESLRMKLWEVLGIASSQKKSMPNSPPANADTTILQSENRCDYEVHDTPKPRQDTDTIETDSENPVTKLTKFGQNQTARRPFTRSLARKKEPSKTLPKLGFQNHNSRYCSSSKQEPEDKPENNNIFTFCEGEKRMGSSKFAANSHAPASVGKKQEIRNSRFEPRRISFASSTISRKSLHGNKGLQRNDENQSSPHSEKKVNRINAEEETKEFKCEVKGKSHQTLKRPAREELIKSNHQSLDNSSNSSVVRSSEKWEPCSLHLDKETQGSLGQCMSKNGYPDIDNSPTPLRGPKLSDHCRSPTFAADITLSPVERKSREDLSFSPILSEEKTRLRTLTSPSSTEAFSSEAADDTRGLERSSLGESSQFINRRTTERCFSPPQVHSQSNGSQQTDEVIIKGFRRKKRRSPEANKHDKSPLAFHRGKRVCSLEDLEAKKLNTSPVFTKFSGSPKVTGSHFLSDHFPEDDLARAITQLAVLLERFKAKIKLHTSKKSSEILASVKDDIHLQLLKVDSLIKADMEKLMDFRKSKRNQLESTFSDKQEKLKAIHDKFKEEINKHLADCKSTLEDMEANKKEFKGNIERQKAAHRKLILEVQEAMEVQIADADTRIASLRKAASKRMDGLTRALREWLTDNGTTR